MCTGRLTTAHNPPHGHGLKEMPTPRRREPPQPEPVACRARSAGLEVTHGQGCRLGLPCPIPAGLEVTHGQACRLGLPCPPE
uniref:Uncharacterized protein n=1 Tax=Fagus sylvatica TaxID=28930 RepID=A0A2N9J8B1_FAGSY